MYEVVVKHDGHEVSTIKYCDALCISYLSEGVMKSVVSAESGVPVSDVLSLGCCSASSVLRTVSEVGNSNTSKDKSQGNSDVSARTLIKRVK